MHTSVCPPPLVSADVSISRTCAEQCAEHARDGRNKGTRGTLPRKPGTMRGHNTVWGSLGRLLGVTWLAFGYSPKLTGWPLSRESSGAFGILFSSSRGSRPAAASICFFFRVAGRGRRPPTFFFFESRVDFQFFFHSFSINFLSF